jgi:transposase
VSCLGRPSVATGALVTLVRARSRQDDGAAFVAALGQLRPQVPQLLVWDNAPPHHPKRVQAAAAAAPIHLVFLPFRAPELLPCADLWRLAKAVGAAHRASTAVHEQAERAVAWLAALTPFERLRKSGLLGLKFPWLAT